MSEIINTKQLESMAESLRLYDVVDGGWAHEDRGLDFNLKHTVLHLSDMVDRKDFTDQQVVKEEIAPDCVSYALRLSRWGGFTVALLGTSEDEPLQDEVKLRAAYMDMSDFADYMLVIKANGILARERRDMDHLTATPYPTGRGDRAAMVQAGSMLLFAAEYEMHELGFDLQQSFDDRLVQLREKYNVVRRDTNE